MTKFLGWVKHFYIPDLYYWLYGDYSGYEEIYSNTPKDVGTGSEYFKQLVDSFREEAESYTEMIEGFHRKSELEETKTNKKGSGGNQ
jgi:hypothetical protein